MFQLAEFFNSFTTLAAEKTVFILTEILTLLESSQYGVYLAVVGICLSIMDHYNKTYSSYFESAMLYTFNAIKRTSFVCFGLMMTSFLLILIFDAFTQSNFMNHLWTIYAKYQSNFVLLVALILLVNKFILVVLIVDLYQDNKVTAIGLLFTASGFYFELKDTPNFELLVIGVAFFTLFVVLGNFNEKYKKASSK